MKTRKKIAFKIFQWLITAMVALIILIPIYWIFISSIKPNEDLFTIPIEWIPKHFTLKSYKRETYNVWILFQEIPQTRPWSEWNPCLLLLHICC